MVTDFFPIFFFPKFIIANGVKKRRRKQKSSTKRCYTRITLSNLIGTKIVKYIRYKEKELPDYRTTDNSDIYSNYLVVGNYLYNAFSFNDFTVYRIVDEERDLDEQERATTDTIRNA